MHWTSESRTLQNRIIPLLTFTRLHLILLYGLVKLDLKLIFKLFLLVKLSSSSPSYFTSRRRHFIVFIISKGQTDCTFLLTGYMSLLLSTGFYIPEDMDCWHPTLNDKTVIKITVCYLFVKKEKKATVIVIHKGNSVIIYSP